jgi:hypothetical protein
MYHAFQVMFAYLSHLVDLGYFREIIVSFLPPGHTHSNLDQKYSVISQHLRTVDMFLLPHVIDEVKPLFGDLGPMTSHFEVPLTLDFAKYYSDKTYKLVGHGTVKINGTNRRLHAFRVTPGPDNRAGVKFKDQLGHPVMVLRPLSTAAAEKAEFPIGQRKKVRTYLCYWATWVNVYAASVRV